METGNEIKSAIKNIRYYCDKIDELARKQFNRDCEIGQVTGINPEPGTKRFDSLGLVGMAITWMRVYCDNIEVNVKHAEEEDEKLKPPPEEKKEEIEEDDEIPF